MPAPEVEHPIINSPYEEPKAHWEIHEHEPAEKLSGRRVATYMYLPSGRSHNVEKEKETGYKLELQLVTLLRERVAEWRKLALRGEGGVSRVTMELLNYWRREGRGQRLFFAQLEAAETIIFLTEARKDLLQGIKIPEDKLGVEKIKDGFTAFERRCCRMATGSGKTMVMAMLAAWSILNKINSPQDKRYSDAVLVMCPNVTIRDRLAELNPKLGEASIYRTRDLVPSSMLSQLAQGSVLTTNWHVFEPQSTQQGNKVVKTGKRILKREIVRIGKRNDLVHGTRYMTEDTLRQQEQLAKIKVMDRKEKNGELVSVEIESKKYVETDNTVVRRVLGKDLGNRGNILVFNDEAHHAYRLHKDDDENALLDDEEDIGYYYKEATVWVDGLDKVHKLRDINMCVDFSATPYFLGKAGENTNRIFPWTVSSFDLQDAIESGLVKIPQFPVRDSSGSSVPGYFNIWKWILPKLTPMERGGKKTGAKPEAILKHAHTPIAMAGGMWDKKRKEMADSDDTRPPVFIIICKTKKLARIVYEWLAENKPPTTTIPSAGLESLRNDEETQNTICVYSDVQKEIESGNAKNDETRWMRFTLDTIGKTEWPRDSQRCEQYPEGFEELADKLKRPKHPPGRDVRCIVSVGMLTEGWDCNTVTHIIGLRPFMSQLLCEQVVGRGLRRLSYELGEDGLMREEIATVLGVPMSAYTVKASNETPPALQQRYHVHSVPSKQDLEIRFPRVEGYRQAVRNRITSDMANVPSITVDPMKTPPETEMKAGLPDNKGRPSLHGPGKITPADLEAFRKEKRLQERIWEMTAALTRHYLEDKECRLPPNAAFAQLLNIVQTYINEKVEAYSPSVTIDAFLSPYYGNVIERLHQSIRPDTKADEIPELPRYERMRGDGSTADVDFWTQRTLYPITKSHINAVVADTKKLEQTAAYHLDKHPKVISFAKNEGMGFGIPYVHNGEMHEYLPDFLVRLQGDNRHLILETKGYDELKEIKKGAAERWVKAVNADGTHGHWEYAMVGKASEIDNLLNEMA